jgi:VWFA-related protein
MHFYRRAISRRDWLSLVTLVPASELRGQSGDRTFFTDVKVVQVFATVRTGKGRIVSDLIKDDFKLEEDGRTQTIRYFSRESDLPLTLGLVLDISDSMRRVLAEVHRASSTFFDQVLREDRDTAFVIRFASEVEELQKLTASRTELQSALSKLEAAAPGQRAAGGTSLYDAIVRATDGVMAKRNGRKAIILLSDGVDNASRATLAAAIASAQKTDTLVYAILIADEQQAAQPPSGGGDDMGKGRMPKRILMQGPPDGKKVMERLARETGGSFFEVSKKQPIGKTYDEIQEELRNQYSLGYTPDRADPGPGYHKIRVTALQKGTAVQTKDGYFADK